MRQTVLVVDDDPIVLESLRRQLQTEFNVLTSNLPSEHLAAQGGFDAVISDYYMPNMNGADFLAVVRRLQPAAFRLLITGGTKYEIAVKAVNQARVHRLLEKPVSTSTLTSTLHGVLSEHLSSRPANEAKEYRKVLIVDDSKIAIESSQLALEEAGFKTVSVNDPLRALSVIRAEKPDILLLDVNMPALNGPRLVAALRAAQAIDNVKIILHSSMPLEILQVEAMKCQAHGVLQKGTADFIAEFELALLGESPL